MTDAEVSGGTPVEGRAEAAQLLAWLKAELRATPDRKLRGLLLLEGARALERAGRVSEAAKTLVTAANTDPHLLPAVWALINIFTKKKSWKNILRLREAEAKAAVSAAERTAALTALGDLQQDQIGDAAAAASAYAAALEASPDDRLTLLSVERSARLSGDLGRLADATARLAAVAADPRARALWLIDLAGLQQSLPDGSRDRALAFLREAAAIEQGRWHWLGALERFAAGEDLPGVQAEALVERARIVAAFASVESAAEAVRFEAPPVADPRSAAAQAVGLLSHAARLRERSGDLEGALEALRFAASLQPEDPFVVAGLVRVLERAGLPEEACAVLERRLALGVPAEESTLLRLELGDLRARAGDPAGAAQHYRAALALSPTPLVAAVGLEAALLAVEGWGDLAAAYEELAGSSETAPALRAWFALRAAEVADRHLDQPDRAIALLRGVGGEGVDSLLARHLAVGILSRRERWRELAAALDELVDVVEETAAATALLAELAAVQMARLGEPVLAVSTYGRLLERDPEARWALEMLAELHAGLEQWGELASVYRRLASSAETDEDAAAYLAVAGWLLRARVGDAAEAAVCYRQALERRPEGALAAAGLEELLRSGHDDGGLRSLLRERAETAASPEDSERTLLALALDHERTGEVEEAATIHRAILDRRGDSPGARVGLIRCLRRSGRWDDLVEHLDAEADRVSSPRDRALLLLEQSEVLADRIGQPALAEDALRRAREADPDLLPAVLALTDVARQNASWQELDELVQETLRLAPEVALLVAEERLALLSGPSRDHASADVIAEVLLQNVPDHRSALLTKALVASALRDGQARAECYAALSRLEGPTEGGLGLAGHARAVALAAGIDAPALPPAPRDGRPRAPELLALADAGTLEPRLALRHLAERCALAGTPASRMPWELELAAARVAAGDHEEALSSYRAVLDANPASLAALEGLRHLASALGLPEVGAETTERLAELCRDEALAAALWASAARTWEIAVGDAGRAEMACRRALTVDPSRSDAFARLLDLLGKKGDRAGQVELLEARAASVDDAPELAMVLLAQGALLLEAGDEEAAAGCLETAALVDGGNREVLRARSRFYLSRGHWDSAVTALMAEASHTEGSDKRLALWRAAEVLDRELGSPGRAVRALRGLADARDPETETYRRLLAVARKAGAWADAGRALKAIADAAEDPQERVAALRAEGRVRAELAGDPFGARRAWQRVVEAAPDDLEAIEALAGLSEGQDRVGLLDALEVRVRGGLRDDPTDGALLRALARVERLRGRVDGLYCVLHVLDALGLAAQEEAEELRALEAVAPREPSRPLAAGSVQQKLRHPGQSGPAEELHAVLGPVLHKIYAADVAALDLGKPLRPRGGDLLYERLVGAGEVLGIERLAVRRGGGDPFGLFAVPAPEPTVGVGGQVGGVLGPAQRFLLGRALWHCLSWSAALAGRTVGQVRALQDAAIVEGERSYAPAERRLGVEALQREVRRHVPRKSRRALTEAAQGAAKASESAMERWAPALLASADRAGLLLAGDLRAALPLAVPGWRGADPAERAASAGLLRASWAGKELLAFALSKAYLALREETGLAVRGA